MNSIEKLLRNSGLVYVDCNSPGYRRRRRGKGFIYLNLRKKQICNPRVKARMESLVIPPQWSRVWICPDPKGHIQVTGTDGESRKQYIYHPKWQELRGHDKFKQLASFGSGLAKLRKAIKRDLMSPDFNIAKVSAIALKIMDITAIRPGNSLYTKRHGSFGLTTLRNKHLHIVGDRISLSFVGKKGVPQSKQINDKQLAGLLGDLQQIPGRRLFQYFSEGGEKLNLEASDLNGYLKDVYQQEVTCKTFRTWSACHAFMAFLCSQERVRTAAARKQTLQRALEHVAALLGNSKLISRKHYISPVLLDDYQSGALESWLMKTGDLSPSRREQAISKKLVTTFCRF